MDEPEFYFNGKQVSEEELQELVSEAEEETRLAETMVMESHGVSRDTASAIVYLRTRSRWTQGKEKELVDRDHAGNPIPLSTVLSGDF